MSLPTPPSTSHRDKENHPPSGSRVVWSQSHQYHCISSPPRFSPCKSALGVPKSILKKREYAVLPMEGEEQRETTPEPSDPLADLTYLQSPISKIIALETPLRELIEAYSVLAARLRSCVSGSKDADASWPLFQPLRKNREALTEALVRDLHKALEEPPRIETTSAEECEGRCSLPSPMKSPRKKGGMTAEQVKHARDLCYTCHAVIRMLAFVFTTPALFRIFTDDQLGSIITELLAIPLADSLPTPNSRKTYALAIWLISVQRLPSEVLLPARDRIAYALRRGIDGELGKEGKKGSVSDGLKAIHDLSVRHPETFVPTFTELLPSVIACVLGSTLTLRVQACHALGGFAYGSASIPRSQIHTRISSIVADSLADGMSTAPTASPVKSPLKSPSKDPPLIRTLRATLLATEPQHPAQGPVWALCVLANLIVLIGPALYTSARLERAIRAMLSVAMRTKRSSVRALLCLVWRCLTWVYFQPPLLPDPDSESEVEEADDAPIKRDVREVFWELVITSKDMGCGVNLVCALLADANARDDERLERAFGVLKAMLKRGGPTRQEAIQVLRRLVSFDIATEDGDGFEMIKLLPRPLFSANPGLLTTDYKSLATVVKPIFSQCPQVEDITPLSREEISKEWILQELVELWKQGFGYIEMPDDADPPEDIIGAWDGIITANVAFLQDSEGDDATAEFAVRAIEILTSLFGDNELDVRIKEQVLSPGPPASSPIKRVRNCTEVNQRSHSSLFLSIMHSLWATTRTAVPHALLSDAGQQLLSSLWKNEDKFTDARREWALLCVDVLLVCTDEDVDGFWGKTSHWSREDRQVSWAAFANKWRQDANAGWEGAVSLLAIPFESTQPWELGAIDVELWENLLTYAVNNALDYGHEAASILDRVAERIAHSYDPTSVSTVRVTDVLLSQLNMSDARELPENLLQFVNETLLSSYPPEPRNLVHVMWMVRTLTDVVEQCPPGMIIDFLEIVGDGVCAWVSDKYSALPLDDYSYNVATMFEMVLATVRPLPATEDTIERLSPLLESALKGRSDKPASIEDALREFWDTKYSRVEISPSILPRQMRTFFGLTEDKAEPEIPTKDVYVKEAASPIPTISLRQGSVLEEPEPAVSLLPPATPVRSTTSRKVLSPQVHRSGHVFHFAPLQSPTSPYATTNGIPTTPLRTPLLKAKRRLSPGSTSVSSPSKRRRLDDKENQSPVIASVMDRILNRAPVFSKPEKRPVPDDCEEEKHPRVLKKSKSFSAFSTERSSSHQESDEERAVEVQLLMPSIQDDVFLSFSQSLEASPICLLKRRRAVMEAVELPSLEQVYGRRSISFDVNTSKVSTPRRRSPLRATRSTSKASRRRLDLNSGCTGASSKSLFTPTRDSFMSKLLGSASPLPEMSIPGSDDSIMAAPTPRSSSDVPSSDDQCCLGVVTPHRLISPVPRRRSFDEDPPSDDSNIGSSPTQQVAARILSRQNSLQQVAQPMKSIMISREEV